MLFYLVETVVKAIIIRRTKAFDGAVEGGCELFRILLRHMLQRPHVNYVEEAREREREEVDAFARVLPVDARPVVDCDLR